MSNKNMIEEKALQNDSKYNMQGSVLQKKSN